MNSITIARDENKFGTIAIAVICLSLLGAVYLAFQQYAERKAHDRAHNEQVTANIVSAIRTMDASVDISHSIADLARTVSRDRHIPLEERKRIGDELEHIQSLALNQAQLIAIIKDRLKEFKPGETVAALQLIDSAFAAEGKPNAEDPLKRMIVGSAFAMLCMLFAACCFAAFFSKNKRAAAFAIDTLKVEIGFLTGLVSSFVVGSSMTG